MERHALLITAAGTGVGWAYAMTLAQQFPDVRLVTADTNAAAWCSAAQLAARHVVWEPFAAGEAYLAQLNALIKAEGITHYLPIIDPEIAFAAEHRERLLAQVMGPDARFTQLALAKQNYAKELSAMGIDSPRPRSREDVAAGVAAMAKLPASFGGRGTWSLQSHDDLRSVPAQAFIQEKMPGAEFTADCMPLGDGRVFVSVRERVETKSGVCTKARIAPHAGMERIAQQLVAATSVESPFCFQAMAGHPGENRLAVTDINPRLGAGTLMSAANGSDFFGAHLAQTFGGEWQERLQRHHERCAITRQYVEFLSPE